MEFSPPSCGVLLSNREGVADGSVRAVSVLWRDLPEAVGGGRWRLLWSRSSLAVRWSVLSVGEVLYVHRTTDRMLLAVPLCVWSHWCRREDPKVCCPINAWVKNKQNIVVLRGSFGLGALGVWRRPTGTDAVGNLFPTHKGKGQFYTSNMDNWHVKSPFKNKPTSPRWNGPSVHLTLDWHN